MQPGDHGPRPRPPDEKRLPRGRLHPGLNVSDPYIAQVKRKCGIKERQNYNKPKAENPKRLKCPAEKERAIREALKYFKMI